VPTLKELQEKRSQLAANIKELADKFNAAGKKWQGEDEAQWTRLNAEYDANKAALDAEKARLEEAAKISERLNAIERDGEDLDRLIGRDGGSLERGPQNRGRFGGGGNSFLANQAIALQGWFMNAQGMRSRITDEHRQAASAIGCDLDDRDFVLNIGRTDDVRAMQVNRRRNAMSVGDPAKGGFTVGQTLVNSLEAAMLNYSGVLQVAEIIRTDNGEPLYWPTIDDTGNTGKRVGEGSDAGDAGDPVVGQTAWSAYDYTSGLLNVSRNLLADSIFNMEQVIGSLMGERLGRKQNADYTSGGGGGIAPRGIVTAAVTGVTAASSTGITWDEVIDLEHSVDPSRRENSAYMLHDSILAALRKLKTGDGQYLWQSGANAGVPDTLNAKPYAINQSMASAMTSGKKTLLYGQLSAYKVRQVGQIKLQRLVERRAEFNQDVFIAYFRADGNLLDAGDHPVKCLVHP